MNKAAAKTGPHPDFPMPHPDASIAVSLAALEEPKTVIAERLGISCRALHELLEGKSVIISPMASRLERVVGGSTDFWFRRQSEYDQWKARKEC